MFAQVVDVFTFGRDQMITTGYFWCWMFIALALSTGYAYFIIGWSAAITAIVSTGSLVRFKAETLRI